MIRIAGILVGSGFALVALLALIFGIGPAFSTLAEHGRFVEPTAEHEFHLAPRQDAHFAHDGLAGHWDAAQLQRGYQVYKEVCSACHSLRLVSFRDLASLGYSEAEVKAEAAAWQVPGIDPTTGETASRPGLPTDKFPMPYANDIAASAGNGGKIPPDLSLITKARKDGSHYVHSLLTGYGTPPAELAQDFPDFEVPSGGYFNRYFASLSIGMAPPLTADGQVTYADGTEATKDQMAQDVAAFLTWTAEPTLVKRKQTGWAVLGFLLFATILAWFAKKQIWADAKPRRKEG